MRALLILLVVASGLGALAAPHRPKPGMTGGAAGTPTRTVATPLPRIGPTARPAITNLRSTRRRRSITRRPTIDRPRRRITRRTEPARSSANRVRATSPHARIPSESEVIRRGEQSMPTKTPEKKATTKAGGGGKSNALQKPLQPSKELAAVVGPGALSRAEAVSKVWGYIRAHNLQNPENRREILADDKLSKVFGKDKVTMFEMNKHLAQHLT